MRIGMAADLLGVSNDTLRRWIEKGRISSSTDAGGKQVVEGVDLARLAQEIADEKHPDGMDNELDRRSARNHLLGIVTNIVSDKVMSQVELQCGPYRIVSLISTEAVHDLNLQVGSVASAVVKATSVSIAAGAK